MKVTLLQTAFVFIFSLLQLTLFAQSLSNYGGGGISGDSKKTSISSIAGTWEAGVMLGPDFYYGDLNPNKFWPGHSVSAAGGIFVMRQFTDVIGIKGLCLLAEYVAAKTAPKVLSRLTGSPRVRFSILQ